MYMPSPEISSSTKALSTVTFQFIPFSTSPQGILRKVFFAMKGITVWAAVYDVFRAYNITTIFGNPGSTGK
jgi:hypothetical protein